VLLSGPRSSLRKNTLSRIAQHRGGDARDNATFDHSYSVYLILFFPLVFTSFFRVSPFPRVPPPSYFLCLITAQLLSSLLAPFISSVLLSFSPPSSEPFFKSRAHFRLLLLLVFQSFFSPVPFTFLYSLSEEFSASAFMPFPKPSFLDSFSGTLPIPLSSPLSWIVKDPNTLMFPTTSTRLHLEKTPLLWIPPSTSDSIRAFPA